MANKKEITPKAPITTLKTNWLLYKANSQQSIIILSPEKLIRLLNLLNCRQKLIRDKGKVSSLYLLDDHEK